MWTGAPRWRPCGSVGTQKERPESAEEPIAHAEVRRTLSRAAQHDQLLLEQEILSDHGSHPLWD